MIGVCGDALMQWKEGAVAMDTARAGRLASWRALQAPLVDCAWRTFESGIAARGVTGVWRTVSMVFLDQAFIMPPSLVGFFTWQAAFEGLSPQTCMERVRDSWLPAAESAMPFWCTVHMVTFSAIPSQHRIAWASCCAVVWNAIISGQNQEAIRREAERQHRERGE